MQGQSTTICRPLAIPDLAGASYFLALGAKVQARKPGRPGTFDLVDPRAQRGHQIRCAPGARATCSAVLFGVLDHCRRPVRSAGVWGEEELLAEGTRCGNLLVCGNPQESTAFDFFRVERRGLIFFIKLIRFSSGRGRRRRRRRVFAPLMD
jgi:hypothetical protein